MYSDMQARIYICYTRVPSGIFVRKDRCNHWIRVPTLFCSMAQFVSWIRKLCLWLHKLLRHGSYQTNQKTMTHFLSVIVQLVTIHIVGIVPYGLTVLSTNSFQDVEKVHCSTNFQTRIRTVMPVLHIGCEASE